MPSLISINATPAQQFIVQLGDYSYELRIFSTDGNMAYDLSIDDVEVVQGFQFVNEVLMLPYEYQEVNGNLLLVVPDDEVPNYEAFGITQFLAYLDEDEARAYRDSIA